MKKQLLFILVTISFNGFAQIHTGSGGGSSILPNLNANNTRVGIGTNLPEYLLDVKGDFNSNQGIFTSSLNNGFVWPVGYSGGLVNDSCIVFSAGSKIGVGAGYNKTRMMNFFDFPQSNRHPNARVVFGLEDRNDFGRYRYNYETNGFTEMLMMNKTQETFLRVYDNGNDEVSLVLAKPNSFLGIGTSSFIQGNEMFRLSVNGGIRAHRVKVYTDWADFVFEKDYVLPTLDEVEKHIVEKGHLIGIPSAKEVAEEGIELGEMNKLLLQKIEELTLYIIQLKKEVDTLKN